MVHKFYKHLPDKEIWMSKKVGIHFQQRPLFEDERRQNDLCQIHANTDLREEVSNKVSM